MFHINNEGKVLPCNAKVRVCPYGSDRHATTKEELYYKIIKYQGQGDVSETSISQFRKYGRLKSLHPISRDAVNSGAPVSTIIATLDWAITEAENQDLDDVGKGWDSYVKSSAEQVYRVLDWGYSVPSYVPKDIEREAYKLFYERNDGMYSERAVVTRNTRGFNEKKALDEMQEGFKDYVKFKQEKLTDDNQEANLNWMKRDFYQFSHDMNTSKLLTQPVFYGNIDEAKKQIEEMEDEEVLAAYDDYLVTDNEMQENVKLANYFLFTYRDDLSLDANIAISEWYSHNHKIYKNWEKNSANRVFISMELGKELDKRGVMRQDSSVRVGRRD